MNALDRHRRNFITPKNGDLKSGTIFNNILIIDDEKFVEEFGKDMWGKTKDPKKKMKDWQDDEERKQREKEEKKRKEEEKKPLATS